MIGLTFFDSKNGAQSPGASLSNMPKTTKVNSRDYIKNIQAMNCINESPTTRNKDLTLTKSAQANSKDYGPSLSDENVKLN